MTSKFIGSVFIIAGTAIGAGMLAMPLTAGFIDYPTTLIVLFGFWSAMYYATLINLEANLRIQKGISISEITKIVFGKKSASIVLFSLGALLYALVAAYIAGQTSLIRAALPESFFSSQLLMSGVFTFLFALIIAAGIHKLDYINRGFLTLKGIFLLGMVFLLTPHIQIENWMSSVPYSWPQWSLMLPVFFTSFGFQVCIPYIVNYCNQDVKILKRAILIGTLLPFLVYALWLGVSKGILPVEGVLSFEALRAQGGGIGLFIEMLSTQSGVPNVKIFNMGYSLLAMTTSFLGVGFALYLLISEKLDSQKKSKKNIAIILSFLPPWLVVQFYPDGFVIALKYAAAFLSVFALLAPAACVWKLRAQQTETSYQAPGGKYGLILIGIIGFGFLWLGL
ncbi:Tyrosine-specific transport protein [Candidatus Bealeia paramacronuclearis]|uniref:Tyrosine-specific transport protein n=1 Tax=Candidatus Bealeia paramacronuclearis TaxID=1921001 RepID=A0ABZ2CA47_9PROT|nr:Tyrosine-specific transport protein [Candidatus Bealeia paramacronuclearis]